MTETQARAKTPLRQAASEQVDGCWLLSEQGVDYLEGTEERIYEILAAAEDLSSLSDELESQATNWFEVYNLSKARANVLRPLQLGPGDTVLEVGAGCGAITRYLGETCGLVDAVEPVKARARVARRRTRDLENVEVFVGAVEDLPTEPAYDTIVMVGVLEYSCSGSADPGDYMAFIRPLAQLLKPGGRIICAIENQLGVKYLAGTPENHTNRVFDGLERYPRGAQVRTFSRKVLETIFRGAGLEPQTLHAFPDYHLSRIVFSDALLTSDASALAWTVPAFPSPANTGERARLASEALLWRTLAEAGVGSHFANAFLVVATNDAGPSVWQEGQLAAFYSTTRQARFATETRVVADGGGIQLLRRRLMGSESRAASGPLTVQARNATFVPGESVLDLMARSDDAGLREWIERWLTILHENVSDGVPAIIDVGPPHMIVGEDSSVSLIDQEMRYAGYGELDVLKRQLIWLGPCLSERTPPERWNGDTQRDVVVLLGAMAGLDAKGEWLPDAVRREAELQALVLDHRYGSDGWEPIVDKFELELNTFLDRRLEDGPLGTREHERRQAAERRLEEALAAPAAAAAEAAELRERLSESECDLKNARRHIAEIEGAFGWRALNRIRPVVSKLAPRDSKRRRLLSGALRAGLGVARTVRRPLK
ncbi:MAG TPA: class I SAM-dependent methyltransferase [Dehalococcoidia bacterium]